MGVLCLCRRGNCHHRFPKLMFCLRWAYEAPFALTHAQEAVTVTGTAICNRTGV